MSLEMGLLVLESVLLIVTIILLVYSIREGKHRDRLIEEIGRTAKILTRQEYFMTVIDSMMDAKEEVIGCITGRLPAGDDKKMTRDIVNTIEQLTGKGVRVKYLLPKFPDRLHIGLKYTKAGAEVLYSRCLMVHNVRFISIDDRFVVLGIPDSIGEKEATKKGYRIPSEGIALILRNYFENCEQQVSFKEYLKEVISQTGATPKHLAGELQIDEQDILQITSDR